MSVPTQPQVLGKLNILCKEVCGGGGGLVAKSCPTLATPRTVAHQAPLFMGFSRQEYWSGLPFPYPGGLPDPGIEPGSPALQTDSLPTELKGSLKEACMSSKTWFSISHSGPVEEITSILFSAT